MMMNPDSSCILDYYVLSNSALTATGWTLEHAETGGSSGGFGWRSHGSHVDWGLPTEPGRYCATLTGWNCSTTGETVEFESQASGGTPVDSALGSPVGTVSMGGYAGSLASSGVSLTFTATTEQYGGTMVVTGF